MAVRFSISGSLRSVRQCIEWAPRIEELGYEGFFTAEHQLYCLEAFQSLAVLAGQTKRLRLATGVTNMVYRDPTILATAAATLNEISDGRAVLGLGRGDGPVYGLGRKSTLMAKFEDGIKTIRELLNGRPITLSTGTFTLRTGKLPVPIYLSVEGPKGLRLAGRIADGVVAGGGFDLRVIKWVREQVAEGAREVGRDPAEIDILTAGMICLDRDVEKARTLARRRCANRAHHNFRFTMETVPPEELEGVQKLMASFDVTKTIEDRADPNLVTEYLLKRFTITGTPEMCVERVKELEAAGVRHILVTPPETGYVETMTAWAKEVMPRF